MRRGSSGCHPPLHPPSLSRYTPLRLQKKREHPHQKNMSLWQESRTCRSSSPFHLQGRQLRSPSHPLLAVSDCMRYGPGQGKLKGGLKTRGWLSSLTSGAKETEEGSMREKARVRGRAWQASGNRLLSKKESTCIYKEKNPLSC